MIRIWKYVAILAAIAAAGVVVWWALSDDTDDVTLALQHVLAGIGARDMSACLEACHTLRECAGHIHHRDAFTWGNVL